MKRGANEKTPVITFVGFSGTGKTTVLEKLIPILKGRGFTIGVIKHDVHHFEIDHPGKDSYRFAHAGADVVAISSAETFAIIEKRKEELELDEVISRLPKVDLIITEGYKSSSNPKIEIHRKAAGNRELVCQPEDCIAVMTDEALETTSKCYSLEDFTAIADVICGYIQKFIAEKN